jgi:hypothetical protein
MWKLQRPLGIVGVQLLSISAPVSSPLAGGAGKRGVRGDKTIVLLPENKNGEAHSAYRMSFDRTKQLLENLGS